MSTGIMKMMETKDVQNVLIFSVDTGGEVPTEVRLVPLAKFFYYGRWIQITQMHLQSMKAAFDRRENDLVIDYEHQSQTGEQAPAAGWVKALEVRDDGLWGQVQWTQKAEEYIKAKEYRYLSPVIYFDYPDAVTGETLPAFLDSVALTNRPFLPSMEAIARREQMDELVKLVGARDETEAQAMVKDLMDMKQQLSQALGEDAPNKIVANVLALKQYKDTVREDELNALREELADIKAGRQVEDAIKAGKVTPAQREWAIAYCKRDPEGFAAFVASAPKVVDDQSVVTGQEQKKGPQFDEATLAMARKFGLDEDFLAKNLGGEE